MVSPSGRDTDHAHFQAAARSYRPSSDGYAGLRRKRVALLAPYASFRPRHGLLRDHRIRHAEGACCRALRSLEAVRRMDRKVAAGRLLSGTGVGEHEKI